MTDRERISELEEEVASLRKLLDVNRERVARAIYRAAFMPSNDKEKKREVPSPGWCWESASEDQREFCRRQAAFAIHAIEHDQ